VGRQLDELVRRRVWFTEAAVLRANCGDVGPEGLAADRACLKQGPKVVEGM
jgi:hypothetical protein